MALIKSRGKLTAEDEDYLKEMCNCNGISTQELKENKAKQVTYFELLFSNFTRSHLKLLAYFPCITNLVIIGQTIYQIEGISSLPNLTELWIVECKLKVIDGLDNCSLLSKLYLHCNQISRIENLDFCFNLQTLWIASNSICRIENLDHLSELKDLNLAENQIKTIGNNLNKNYSLYRINLSGNPINSIKELIQLSLLPKLKELFLEDPKYSACPVTLTCNYSLQALHLFQKLYRLDSIDLTNPCLVENLQSVIHKKTLYYRMEMQSIKNELDENFNYIQRLRFRLCQPIKDRIRSLNLCVKQIERLIECGNKCLTPTLDANKFIDHQSLINLTSKMRTILQRIDILQSKLNDYEKKYLEAFTKFCIDSAFKVGKLRVEFRSYGNVYFENGKKSSKWFKACDELIAARFCEHDFQKVGIQDVKILEVIQIQNKVYDMQCEIFENEILDLKGNKSEKYKPEFLFHSSASDVGLLLDIAENGCSGSTPIDSGDMAVTLTNSLFQADRNRIELEIGKYSKKPATKGMPHRFAYFLLCKCYLKPYVQIPIGSKITQTNYPNAKSVCHLTNRPQSPSKASNLVPRCYSALPRRSQSPIPSNCDCNIQFNMYHVFDCQRVIPQYIILVEYQAKILTSSPFLLSRRHSRSSSECRIPLKVENDQDLTKLDPFYTQKLELINDIDDEEESIHKEISELSIIGRKDFSLSTLESFSSLTTLTLSFVEISNLSSLPEFPCLESLNLSYNKIKTIEDMKNYNKLVDLDLSWNELTSIQTTMITLVNQVPEIRSLDLRHNMWTKEHAKFRELVTSCLRMLKTLNGMHVAESALYSAMSIPLPLMLTHSYAIPSKLLYTLGLCFTNEYMMEWGITKTLARAAATSASAFCQITVLDLSRQNLLNLAHVEKLVNLKNADFSHNYLQDLTGIEKCYNLEELSVENNCIYQISPVVLKSLTRLKVLDISGNMLSTFPFNEALDSNGNSLLPDLSCLIASSNQIQSLDGIENLKSLHELFVSQNNIRNMSNIRCLKDFINLEILDLSGNFISRECFYRLYVLFQAQNLTYLDGLPVRECEVLSAHQRFGGHLTMNVIGEHVGHINFSEITQLDLPNCSLKNVDLDDAKSLDNLKSLNLENNCLTTFNGLINLPNLLALCLNNNKICSFLPDSNVLGNKSLDNNDNNSILEKLEVLHLGYNEINDVTALQLFKFSNLKVLFLQGNQMTCLTGFKDTKMLEVLVLDRNKIKDISSDEFISLVNLRELYLEENRIKELCNFDFLHKLERLFLGFNRIQEIEELEKLSGLNSVIELSLVSNPVCRKYLHRPTLISRLPNVIVMDGTNVTYEERCVAEEQKAVDGFMSNNTILSPVGSCVQPWLYDISILPRDNLLSPDKNNPGVYQKNF